MVACLPACWCKSFHCVAQVPSHFRKHPGHCCKRASRCSQFACVCNPVQFAFRCLESQPYKCMHLAFRGFTCLLSPRPLSLARRSLDWCCSIELLFLVGAPAQAFERIAARFYNAIEWFEKNALGWDIPEDEGTMPMYENIKLYYPVEHAYTFDQYKHSLSLDEKKTLLQYYALRW